MKLQALLLCTALAAGTAFAQAPAGTTPMPPDAPSAAPAAPAPHATQRAKAHKAAGKKHASKHANRHAKKKHASRHAAAKRAHGTNAMGAGAASPTVDLNSPARQRRMEQAYEDWQATQRKR